MGIYRCEGGLPPGVVALLERDSGRSGMLSYLGACIMNHESGWVDLGYRIQDVGFMNEAD
jgi:hypothetical protein